MSKLRVVFLGLACCGAVVACGGEEGASLFSTVGTGGRNDGGTVGSGGGSSGSGAGGRPAGAGGVSATGSGTAGSGTAGPGTGGTGSGGSSGTGTTQATSGAGGATSGSVSTVVGSGGSASGGNGGAGAGVGGAGAATGGSGIGGAGTGGAGTGGAGGGGGAGAPPECATAADCKLFSDCCTCQALARGEPPPPMCPVQCLAEKCNADHLPKDAVACVAGRCVAGFECDSSKVTCGMDKPKCEPGLIAAVRSGCYSGACVLPTECTRVHACSDCGSGDACVANQTRAGSEFHCVTVPPACRASATCGCLGTSVCRPPYTTCTDSSAMGITCGCPTCG